jgi:hypothetical protein
MKPTTEQLLGAIQVLTEQKIMFCLPNHETAYWEPMAWESDKSGEFNLFNLITSRAWVTETDIEIVIQGWQELDNQRYLNNDDYPETYDNCFNDDTETDRTVIYKELCDFIKVYSQETMALKLSSSPYHYSFYIVLVRISEDRWICISPTAPQEKAIETEVSRSPIERHLDAVEIDQSILILTRDIKKIINQVQPIKVYGYYGGGYDYHFDNFLVYGLGKDKGIALSIALEKAGMSEFSCFDQLSPTFAEWMFEDERINGLQESYDTLNRFFKESFSTVRMLQCSFWDYQYVCIAGQSADGNWIGIYSENSFDFNP